MSQTRKRPGATRSDMRDQLLPDNNHGRNHPTKAGDTGLEGDYWNIALLLFLYMLQGVPIGMSQTMDLVLQEKGITYEEQGVYGSVSWPYSLKLLWAPIVDSVYSRAFGRRKTWLVPTQLLLGVMLFFSPSSIMEMLGEGQVDEGGDPVKPDVHGLTAVFFCFYLLAATQDIALDGWAVTMLSPRNRGWASTCNAIGQTFGYFLSFTGYLILKTYDICDLYTFMKVWGVVFILTTCAVWFFKREVDEEEDDMTVREAYGQMVQVLRIQGVQALLVILFTRGIAFCVTDNLTQRKLVEKGMKKEHVASLMVLITPLSIILPGIISNQTSDRPLSLLSKTYLPRVALGIFAAGLVYLAPNFHEIDSLPISFTAVLIAFVTVHAALSTAMFVAIMAFFAQVSDPVIGGTYMTLLNTIANLGSKWPNQVVLFIVEYLNVKQCTGTPSDAITECSTKETEELCLENGGTCELYLDGYYVVGAVCVVLGMVWYKVFAQRIERLQNAPTSMWRVNRDPRSE